MKRMSDVLVDELETFFIGEAADRRHTLVVPFQQIAAV